MLHLTARDIADACGVTPKTIHRWAASGRLPEPRRGLGGHGWARWPAAAVAAVLRGAGYAVPASWEAAPAQAA